VARIDRFTSRMQAEMACGLLQANGFQARVSADDAGGVHPDIPFGIGGTAVVVPDAEYEEAIALLDAAPSAWQDPDHVDGPATGPSDPDPTADDTDGLRRQVGRRVAMGLSALLLLLFVLNRLDVFS
jgi:hypothetical protein